MTGRCVETHPENLKNQAKSNHRKQTTRFTSLVSHGFSFASFFWRSDEGGQTNSSFCSTGDSSSSCNAHANHCKSMKSSATLLSWQETDQNGNALKIDQEAHATPNLFALSHALQQELGTKWDKTNQNKTHTHRRKQKHTETHRNTCIKLAARSFDSLNTKACDKTHQATLG